jgi:hypothetical protein
MQLKINKKNYAVKFGYGAYRRVCEHYGLKKVSGFNDLIKRFKLDKMDDPTFAQMDFIGNLVVAGVHCADEMAAVNSDDVIDVLWVEPELLAKVMESFTDSMPKASPEPQEKGK